MEGLLSSPSSIHYSSYCVTRVTTTNTPTKPFLHSALRYISGLDPSVVPKCAQAATAWVHWLYVLDVSGPYPTHCHWCGVVLVFVMTVAHKWSP